MNDLLVLIPLLPLVAAVVNFLFGRWFIKDLAGPLASLAVLGSWVLSLLAFIDQIDNDEPLIQHLYTWIPAGDFNVPLALHVDHLSAAMLMVVTTVSTLVHVYAIGYMHGDPGFYRFFSYLPLFVVSMIMLVLADNFLVLFLGWEGVGLCSYLLIGFWFDATENANAAKKAFVTNRIGDAAMLVGLALIVREFGTLDFDEVFGAAAGTITSGVATAISLLLFAGAIGKSAQVPLTVWLPDAMAGPTPVSALIHAATMVTAGVYLVVRAHLQLEQKPNARDVVGVVGLVKIQ